MTQPPSMPKTCTDAKTCVSCTFLKSKTLRKLRLSSKCLLTGQTRNPNMYACTFHERRNQ